MAYTVENAIARSGQRRLATQRDAGDRIMTPAEQKGDTRLIYRRYKNQYDCEIMSILFGFIWWTNYRVVVNFPFKQVTWRRK